MSLPSGSRGILGNTHFDADMDQGMFVAPGDEDAACGPEHSNPRWFSFGRAG